MFHDYTSWNCTERSRACSTRISKSLRRFEVVRPRSVELGMNFAETFREINLKYGSNQRSTAKNVRCPMENARVTVVALSSRRRLIIDRNDSRGMVLPVKAICCCRAADFSKRITIFPQHIQRRIQICELNPCVARTVYITSVNGRN